MRNTYNANEKEFQEKYFELVAAIKESDKNCSKEERRYNQLLLSLADEVRKERLTGKSQSWVSHNLASCN